MEAVFLVDEVPMLVQRPTMDIATSVGVLCIELIVVDVGLREVGGLVVSGGCCECCKVGYWCRRENKCSKDKIVVINRD